MTFLVFKMIVRICISIFIGIITDQMRISKVIRKAWSIRKSYRKRARGRKSPEQQRFSRFKLLEKSQCVVSGLNCSSFQFIHPEVSLKECYSPAKDCKHVQNTLVPGPRAWVRYPGARGRSQGNNYSGNRPRVFEFLTYI